MSGHGPDVATFEKASVADTTVPVHIVDTMAFMFESRSVLKPRRGALHGTPPLQSDYLSHWQGLKKRFDPAKP
jgi:homogentisate 1,2-dioxygenase